MGAPMRYQPQGLARPASAPLARGLLSARVGNVMGGGVASPRGVALNQRYMDVALPRQVMGALSELTIVTLALRTNTATASWATRYRASGNVNNVVVALGTQGSSSSRGLTIVGPAASASTSTTYLPSLAAGASDLVFAAGSWQKDNTTDGLKLYVNGVLAATASAGTSFIAGSAGNETYHCDATGGGANTAFRPLVTLVYSRVLSADELDALYANPWQVFEEADDWDDVAETTLTADVLEVLSASDTCDAVVTCAAAQAEAGAAAEQSSATSLLDVVCGESAAAADSQAGAATLVGAQAEFAVVSDATSGSAAMVADQAEACAAADTASGTMVADVAVAETASASDVSDQGGASISADIAEAASAAESCGALATIAAVCAEVAAATESVAALLSVVAAAQESAVAFDLVAAIGGGEVVFARAPTGSGYTPRRNEQQSRPTGGAQARPAAAQRNFR